MGFIDHKPPKQTKHTPTEEDYVCARKLYEALLAKRLVTARPRMTMWADQFRLLRTAPGVPPERIAAALDWYCENPRGKYIPQAYSAHSFRQKFTAIEASMERGLRPHSLTVGSAARMMFDKMGLRWPGKEKEEELGTIQTSLDNYHEYRQRLAKAANPLQTLRDQMLLNFLVLRNFDENLFVENWMREVHKIAWSWDMWRGKLSDWAFTVDSNLFTRMQEELVKSYCGQASRWQRAKELIK